LEVTGNNPRETPTNHYDEYYLTQPFKLRQQLSNEENEEYKGLPNEECCDLEIPSPRAEPLLDEEDDGKYTHCYRNEGNNEGIGVGEAGGTEKVMGMKHHHLRAHEMSNNLPEIKEKEAME
jgi:hypothetical protein